MSRVLAFVLTVILTASAFRSAVAGEQHRKRTVDPILTVIMGFDIARDGSVHNFRVVRCENPSDHSEVKGALTPREQSAAIGVFTRGTVTAPPSEAGKTMYTYLHFDRRTRQFTQ